MLPKFVLLVTCLYVVQALVIDPPRGGGDTPDDQEFFNDEVPADVADNEVIQDAGGDETANNDDNTQNEIIEQDDFNTQDVGSSARTCFDVSCNSFCRSRGYVMGRCLSASVCRCYRGVRTSNENDAEGQKINEEGQDADEEGTNADKFASEDFNTQTVAEEDKSEAAVALSSVRSCTHAACDRFCRQRGWHWGRCISATVCRCYRIVRTANVNNAEGQEENAVNRAADQEVNTRDEIASEDFNIQTVADEDKSEAAVALSSARSCTHAACDRFCRLNGWHWGNCISATVCRCYRIVRTAKADENEVNQGNEEVVMQEDIARDDVASEDFNTQTVSVQDKSEAAMALSSARSCTHAACDRFCRLNGWHWGNCISATVCRCYRIVRTTNVDNAEGQEENVVNRAADQEENTRDKIASEDFNTQTVADEDKSEAAVALSSARSCTHAACDRFCRLNGWHWGNCISATVCRCYRIVRTANADENEVNQGNEEVVMQEDIARDDVASEDFNTQTVSVQDKSEAAMALSSARSCTHAACDRFCRLNGWHWGNCISATVCRCYRIVRTTNVDNAEGQEENVVNRAADQEENTRDKIASEDFNTQTVADEDKSEAAVALSSARSCTHAACDRFCRLNGWHWGNCISATVCRCYRIVRTANVENPEGQEEHAVNRAADQEENTRDEIASEDFNTQTVADEDKSEAAVALSSARSCTHAACDRFCRLNGWHWGNCISATVCRCYRIVRALDGDIEINGVQYDEINRLQETPAVQYANPLV